LLLHPLTDPSEFSCNCRVTALCQKIILKRSHGRSCGASCKFFRPLEILFFRHPNKNSFFLSLNCRVCSCSKLNGDCWSLRQISSRKGIMFAAFSLKSVRLSFQLQKTKTKTLSFIPVRKSEVHTQLKLRERLLLQDLSHKVTFFFLLHTR